MYVQVDFFHTARNADTIEELFVDEQKR